MSVETVTRGVYSGSGAGDATGTGAEHLPPCRMGLIYSHQPSLCVPAVSLVSQPPVTQSTI